MKKILITGARSGIIKNVINRIIKKYYLYITVHTEKEVKRLKEEYNKYNNVSIFKLDITNKKDKEKLKNIDIDIIILNAAIGYGGSLLELKIEKIKENYEVNVFSNIEIIQYLIPKMIKKDYGRIIIVSSIAGILPIEFMGSYCSTKASLIMIAQILKKELKLLNSKIKVKLIEPGIYKTGFNEIMRENKNEYIKQFKNKKKLIELKEHILFDILCKQNLTSISKQIVNAIEDNKNKFVYSAPLSTKIFSKIYQIFKT